MKSALTKTSAFCARFGLKLPILLAPMAGASAPPLSIAVANTGGLGACGALLMQPAAILSWAAEVRAGTNGSFQLNSGCPIRNLSGTLSMRRVYGDFLAGSGTASPARGCRCDATRFRRAVRGVPASGAAHCVLCHGIVSARLGGATKGQTHRLVRQCLDRGRGARGRGGGGRCGGRTGHGGWWPPRLLPCGQGRGRDGRIICPDPRGGGRGAHPGGGDWRNCGCPRCGGSADFGGISCTDWHGLSPLPGGADRPGLGRCDWPHSARGDYGEPRFSGRAGRCIATAYGPARRPHQKRPDRRRIRCNGV